MKYKWLFFDLDGTISNTLEGVTNAAEYTFEKLGQTNFDRSLVSQFIGPPLQYSFEVLCGFSPEKTARAIKIFREYYGVRGWKECQLFDGMHELLVSLVEAGYHLAVATSKSEAYALPLLEMLGVRDCFEFVSGSCDDIGRTSKSDVIEHALTTLSIFPSEALMIGDTKYDVEGANSCGLDSMGVLFGFGSRQSLQEEGATYIAESVSHLGEMLLACK